MSGVAVIVPVRDGRRHLPATLASVLAQTFAPIELVVVDDGSIDGSGDLAASVDPRVRLIRQEALGLGAARNLGVSSTASPLLAFLDGDDVWSPDTLTMLTQALDQSDSPIAVGMVEHFFSPEISPAMRTDRQIPAAPLRAMFAGGFVVRRECWDAVGPMREDVAVGEMVDWLARVAETGITPTYISQTVVWRRVHDHNTGTLRRKDRVDYARVARDALVRRRTHTRP